MSVGDIIFLCGRRSGQHIIRASCDAPKEGLGGGGKVSISVLSNWRGKNKDRTWGLSRAQSEFFAGLGGVPDF